ncbi:MAG TPA: hypothetical protein VK922_18480 [Gemmatimonadaceae bacterium]|nr:hypothetical protein [Gemmatimonadaceae bacterium]
MTTDRSAALALVAGSLAGLLVMALHPTGGEVSREAAAGGSMFLVQAVHWLAILAQPVLLAGTLALTLRLRARFAIAVGAFIFFAVAGVVVLIAAAASGLVSPGVLRGMHDAGDAGAAMTVQNFLHYTFLLNQAFARIYVVLGAVAIALWSWAILGGRELPRALAVFGLLLGTALLAGLASGHLTLGIHGFGLVILGQSVWLIWAAAALWRGGERPEA